MGILSLEPGSSGHPQAEKRVPAGSKTRKRMPTGPFKRMSPQATSPSSETHACLGLRLLAGSSCREHTVTRASMLRP